MRIVDFSIINGHIYINDILKPTIIMSGDEEYILNFNNIKSGVIFFRYDKNNKVIMDKFNKNKNNFRPRDYNYFYYKVDNIIGNDMQIVKYKDVIDIIPPKSKKSKTGDMIEHIRNGLNFENVTNFVDNIAGMTNMLDETIDKAFDEAMNTVKLNCESTVPSIRQIENALLTFETISDKIDLVESKIKTSTDEIKSKSSLFIQGLEKAKKYYKVKIDELDKVIEECISNLASHGKITGNHFKIYKFFQIKVKHEYYNKFIIKMIDVINVLTKSLHGIENIDDKTQLVQSARDKLVAIITSIKNYIQILKDTLENPDFSSRIDILIKSLKEEANVYIRDYNKIEDVLHENVVVEHISNKPESKIEEEPKMEEPKMEEPKMEEPKMEESKIEEPKIEEESKIEEEPLH